MTTSRIRLLLSGTGAMYGWRSGEGKNKLEEGYRKRIYWRDICMGGEQ
jgi:hypothetical protein